MNGFAAKGWRVFPADPALLAWAKAALKPAVEAVKTPENKHWHQCEGTWFVGVDALENDNAGRIGGAPLGGAAYEFACSSFGALRLHKAQVSVVYPGYPKARVGEGEAALNYRVKRDAAHLDGLKHGAGKRRFMEEYHTYILGIPLTACSADASPLVVWEGSREIMHSMLKNALQNTAPERWHEVDLTEAYQAARRVIFERCQRVEVSAQPGEAYVVHRFALHGMAPWGAGATAPKEGRMMAYFRPALADRAAWLNEA